jgi:hypothetical protein
MNNMHINLNANNSSEKLWRRENPLQLPVS